MIGLDVDGPGLRGQQLHALGIVKMSHEYGCADHRWPANGDLLSMVELSKSPAFGIYSLSSDYLTNMIELPPNIAAILSSLPRAPPPNGTLPNFVDPVSNAPVARILTCLTLGIMYFFLVLRVYTRSFVTGGLGADDYLCFAAAFTHTAFCGLILSVLDNPLGPHSWDLPLLTPDDYLLKVSAATVSVYALSSVFLKAALLTMYLRIFRASKPARVLILSSLVVISLVYVALAVADIAECSPRLRNLNDLVIDVAHFNLPRFLAEFKAYKSEVGCVIPLTRLSAALSVFSVVTDFYVLAIPTGMLLSLKLSKKRKIGVSAIFLTGLLATSFSIAATVYRLKLLHSLDYDWVIPMAFALTAAEISIGVACCCMPVVFVVFNLMGKSIKDSWSAVARRISTGKEHSNSHLPDHIDKEPVSNSLPKIPNATMRGLKSFIHNLDRSRVAPEIKVHTYNELASRDENYHTYI
ncbi:hypothetical protein HD806DRAFT_550285 [Xylariaceae sp. AK1471]|nr:hypothetical protein HD806DRAFT_550285 [Xylariaceae sp. AK1471]